MREEDYGEVAAVNETLSSTGQILLGLNYCVQEKMSYYLRVYLEVYLMESTTTGQYIGNAGIHSCHYTLNSCI